MKSFFAKFFDLRAYDNWNLGLFFVVLYTQSILSSFIPDEYAIPFLIVSVLATTAVIFYDWHTLRKFDFRNAPSPFWIVLLPIYLYRRERNKSNRRVAHLYLISFLALFLLSVGIEESRTPDRVAEDVCPIMNTIEIYQNANVTCVRAYNFAEQYPGFWKGRVHLSNHLIVSVTADYNKSENHVYVQTQGIADDSGY